MRKAFQQCAAVVGGVALIATPAIAENGPAIIFGWLAASILLLFVGREFTFQQKQ